MRNGHKFNAVRTEVDGIAFSSKAEAKRYAELKLLQKAGKINTLILQPRYDLSVDNANYHDDGRFRQVPIGKYVADFAYVEVQRDGTGRSVVEDVKGVKTALYRWKKKHFETQYGIQITEVYSRHHADKTASKAKAGKKAKR